MVSNAVQDAINDQIHHELYSAYIYLSMVAYFESKNLEGFAHWMRLQAQEEVAHAMRLFDHVHDRGGRVVLQAVDQPPAEFESPLDVFQKALEHERNVTGMIHRLYELARQENDYPTQVMLQWFIDEQVEEEKTAEGVVEQLRMAGGDATALLMLDAKLGARPAGAEA